MTPTRLGIITEASDQIGTGHLLESICLAKKALKEGIEVSLWISKGSPSSLLSRVPCPYHLFGSLAGDIGAIAGKLAGGHCQVVIVNCRLINNSIIGYFNQQGIKTICIDELGNRSLDSDIIINPMIAGKYHIYPPSIRRRKIYKGPDYMIMSGGIIKAGLNERLFDGRIKTISVAMGGVDRSGATFRLLDILVRLDGEIRKNIILGGGFVQAHRVYDIVRMIPDKNFNVYHNISGIESFFLDSDVVFTAGGNTLYELACVGTPPVVLFEDEHEKDSGLVFQNLGFGFTPVDGIGAREDIILGLLQLLDDPTVRQEHSDRGKALVDGRGCERILEIIRGYDNNDSSVETFY